MSALTFPAGPCGRTVRSRALSNAHDGDRSVPPFLGRLVIGNPCDLCHATKTNEFNAQPATNREWRNGCGRWVWFAQRKRPAAFACISALFVWAWLRLLIPHPVMPPHPRAKGTSKRDIILPDAGTVNGEQCVCGGGNNVTFSLRLGVCVCLLVLPFHLTLPSMWVVLQWNWFPPLRVPWESSDSAVSVSK